MTDNGRFLAILAGVGAVAGVVVLLMRKSAAASPSSSSALVFHRQRAAGVDRRLVAFLDWWEINGPFPIVIDPQGGVRRDEAAQKALFDKGSSNAASLSQTAHGRGGALDVYPVLRSSGHAVQQIATNDRAKFQVIGEAAEKLGLTWGGRWKSLYDGPHIEVPNWKQLPFPPGGGVAVA